MKFFTELTSLYVSPEGGGTGLEPESPATLESALNTVVEMRGGGLLQPISIKMRGGMYAVSSPLYIGNPVFSLTFEPFGNEKPVISGSKALTGFKDDEFMGKKCVSLFIPEVKNGSFNFIDLYKDGKRLSRTRWPENGGFSPEEVEGGFDLPLFSKVKVITSHNILPENAYALNDIEFRINQRWIDEHSVLEAYDYKTGRLELRYPTRFKLEKNECFWFENTAESFGKPGQWYLDRQNGKLFYTPESGEDTAELTVYAPVAKTLFIIAGRKNRPVRNIRLKNITLAYTSSDYIPEGETSSDPQSVCSAGGTVDFRYAEGCELTGCSLIAYGLHGANLAEGCKNVAVKGCDFIYGGAGGVRINGAAAGGDETDMTSYCTVEGCRIAHCGRRWQAGCGVLLMHAFSCRIAKNDIYDLYYTGISGGWVWGYSASVTRDNSIEYNRIHTIGQGQLSDMGGVYLLGAQPGTVVRNNVIYDIKSHDYGGWALYTDEGSTGILLEDNICYDTSENGYHQHYGTSNTVRNNIFACTKGELMRVSRPEAHLSIIFENNIIYSDGTPVYGLTEQHMSRQTVGSDRNIIWNADGKDPVFSAVDGYTTLDGVHGAGMDLHSIVADPGFADAQKHDFTLCENSPVYKMGFNEIDSSAAGTGKAEI